MGQGTEVKTRQEPQVEIQERGEIFFFYRPKVNREDPRSVDDVQRLYILMRPESGETPVEEKQDPLSGKQGSKTEPGDGGEGSSSGSRNRSQGGHGVEKVNIEKQPLLRFIVMGKKYLPDPRKRSKPFWGFVELVTTNVDDVKKALKGEEYDTATRGHRHKPAARAVGEGIYRILRHKPKPTRKHHTHLVYKLEFPSESHEPQESLNIETEGSFLIQIKNPDQQRGRGRGREGLQRKRKAQFPAHLQGQLGHTRFGPADPPDFLNYEGCELLLISASENIEKELGIELETEGGEGDDVASCCDVIKTFGDDVDVTPLLKGTWD